MKKRGIVIFMCSCFVLFLTAIAVLIFANLNRKEIYSGIAIALSMLCSSVSMIILLRSGFVKE